MHVCISLSRRLWLPSFFWPSSTSWVARWTHNASAAATAIWAKEIAAAFGALAEAAAANLSLRFTAVPRTGAARNHRETSCTTGPQPFSPTQAEQLFFFDGYNAFGFGLGCTMFGAMYNEKYFRDWQLVCLSDILNCWHYINTKYTNVQFQFIECRHFFYGFSAALRNF